MRWRRGLHLLLLAVVIKLSSSCIAGDEFLCSEATAHVEECCPSFDARQISCDRDLACKIDRRGGGPTISQRASSCLLDKSCDAIRAANICASLADPQAILVSTANSTYLNVEGIACRP